MRGLRDSTELIISAKHGQSPIIPVELHKIGDPIRTILSSAGVTAGQNTEDDISLIWLTDQNQTARAVNALLPEALQSVRLEGTRSLSGSRNSDRS